MVVVFFFFPEDNTETFLYRVFFRRGKNVFFAKMATSAFLPIFHIACLRIRGKLLLVVSGCAFGKENIAVLMLSLPVREQADPGFRVLVLVGIQCPG